MIAAPVNVLKAHARLICIVDKRIRAAVSVHWLNPVNPTPRDQLIVGFVTFAHVAVNRFKNRLNPAIQLPRLTRAYQKHEALRIQARQLFSASDVLPQYPAEGGD